MINFLFYHKLKKFGGAENLFLSHRKQLDVCKAQVITCSISDELQLTDFVGYRRILRSLFKNFFSKKTVFIHSNIYIGFLLFFFFPNTKIRVFLHQPFTMTKNSKVTGVSKDKRFLHWFNEIRANGMNVYDWLVYKPS